MAINWTERRVVITGLGVVTPLGNLDTFWPNLVAGQCGIDRIAQFDATAFDTQIAGIIGAGVGGLDTVTSQHKVLIERGPGRLSPFMIPMLISNMASGMFSMYQNLRGPNYATVSACATANHAIGEAWRTIKMGDAVMMFAGGAEAAIVPIGIGGFCAMKAMSTRNDAPQKASRPFDKERDGFVMGEGS